MRVLLWAAGVVAALALAAVVALPIVANGDAVRRLVSDAARAATGRALTFGDIAISLPTLSLVVEDVRLSGDAARIGAVALSLDARALLRRELVIDGLTVSDPRIAIGAGGDDPGTEAGASAPAPRRAGADGPAAGGGMKVSLRSFRVERGVLSVRDDGGRETLAIADIALAARAPAPDRPVSVTGRLTLNRRPVALTAALGTLDEILSGAPFDVEAAFESGAVSARYEGSAGTKPFAFDGEATLETTSVGDLLAWAGRPLPEGAADPGALRFAARFARSEGGAVEMTGATLTGDGVDAGAEGRFDFSGAVPEAHLAVEAETVDVDRYWPPPPSTPPPPSFAAASAESAEAAAAPAPEELSAEPFDTGFFGGARGEFSLHAGTVRFRGEEAGPVDLAVTATGQGYRAALRRLALYGGTASGDAMAENADGVLTLEAAFSFDSVSLARAAPAAGGGIVGGKASVSGAGANLRALVESLAVSVDASLTEAVLSAPQLAEVSSLSLTARAAPGSGAEISMDAIHGGAPARVALAFDPLPALAGEDGSALVATLDSDALDARWEGAAVWRPAPAFDGALTANAASVAALAARLGRPLPEGAADPGALRLEGALSAGDSRFTLTGATLQANALTATGEAEVDISAETPRIAAALEVAGLDVEALATALASRPARPAAAADAETAPSPPAPPTARSVEPFALDGLRAVDADVRVRLSDARYRDLVLEGGDLSLRLEGGVARVDVADGALAGGTAAATATVDGSGETPGVLALEAAFSFDGVSLARAAPAAGGGIVGGKASVSGAGAHVRALVESLTVAVDASLTDAAFPAPQLADLSSLSLTARAAPGSGVEVAADAVHGGAPARIALVFDPLPALAGGDASALVATLDSDALHARWEGAAAWRPAPAFDGALTANAASIAALAARLGRPLPEGAADPGTLRLEGALSAGDSRFALTEATLWADALTATGDAEVDISAETPRVAAALEVAGLDVEALAAALASRPARPAAAAGADAAPPPSPPELQEPQAAWSDEPFALDGLRAVDADVRVRLSDARYRGLVLERGDLSFHLEGGVARAEVADGVLAGGTTTATATVDASGETPSVNYALNAAGVSARPLLAALAGTDKLSGRLDFSTRGASAGASPAALVSTLNGDGALTLANGAVAGIGLEEADIAGLLQRAVASILHERGDGPPRTDFDSLHGAFVVTDGEVVNEDMTAQAPLFGLSGSGRASLPRRSVDYRVVATLAAHAGGDNILAGVPVPVRISGPWTGIEYEVAWDGVLAAVATDPARVAALPAGVAIGAAELGIELPAGLTEGALGALGAVVGEALAPSAGAGKKEENEPAPALPLPIPDPVDLLGDLLGR